MPETPETPPVENEAGTLAEALLEAQVRWHLAQLDGEQREQTLTAFAEEALAAVEDVPLAELVDVDALKDVVRRSLDTVAASAAVAAVIETFVEVAAAGPATPYRVSDVVDRDQVEALLDRLLAAVPLLDQALDRLTESPQLGASASRFMGRVVGEVVQANQAMANKVPGLGSLMSFGTTAAARVVGTADKQLDGLLGAAAGKGGTYAVKRLNRILVDTLNDPTTRAAALEVWDLVAAERVRGLSARANAEDELRAIVDAGADLVVTTLATEQVGALADAVVDALLERLGGYSPTELLDELELPRDVVVADLARFAVPVLDTLRDSGALEMLVRRRIEPFFASPEARALLG